MTTTATAPTKAEQLGRDYVDRLILSAIIELGGEAKLSDLAEKLHATGLPVNAIHALLATNSQRFAYFERKWSASIGTADPNAAIATAALGLVRGYGAPMPVGQLAIELGNHFHRDPEHFEKVIQRLVPGDENMFLTATEHVGLANWLYLPVGGDEEENLFYNDMRATEIEPWLDVAKGVDWRKPEAPVDFLDAAGKPVSGKVIGYFACQALNSPDPYALQMYDAKAVFDSIFTSDKYIFASDGQWHPASDAKKWLTATARLVEKLEPAVELEDTQPLEIKKKDVDDMVKRVLGVEDATSAASLLADAYDVRLGDRSYDEDINMLLAALREREELLWVGGERFRKPGTEPPFVHEVPEALQYEKHEFTDDDGEVIDLELEHEAFSSSLRKELGHALAQDVMDDEPGPLHKHLADEVRCVVKAHHKELGTFPLAQIPTGWLPQEPALQELVLEDPKGRTLNVWVNMDIRLMFGLIAWYGEQEIESGAVFILRKTNDSSRLVFRWAEEPDPLCYISAQRMEELRELQERAEELSTLEILMEIMTHYNKGADFITIVTETNVVRRVTRDLIASILTGYHCFYQRAGSPVWHFDQKKVVQGADKSKRKYAKK